MVTKSSSLTCTVLLLCLAFFTRAFAQNAGDSTTSSGAGTEDDFFSSADVEVKDRQQDVKNVDEMIDRESVSLSGEVTATGMYALTRDFLTDGYDENFDYFMSGDLLLEARLRKGFKAFIDFCIDYSNSPFPSIRRLALINPGGGYDPSIVSPGGTLFVMSEDAQMLIGLKEIFIDFNIANTVYFRIGKQVLQWGLGYLWNPTDTINIERKGFMDPDARRDGTFGSRTDITFNPNFSLYTFLGFQDTKDIADVSFAGRMVFLVGTVEMGVSGWGKREKLPIFGVDISAPLFGALNFYAEASASWGFNTDKMRIDGTTYSIRDRIVPRITAGLSDSFDAADVHDRVLANVEFYYNGAGYDENMFESLNPIDRMTFVQEGYYSPGHYGKYYGAIFITINDIFTSTSALTLSALGNFSDMSFSVITDLSIVPVNNFTISFKPVFYFGADLREFTIDMDASNLAVRLKNNMVTFNVECSVAF